MPRKPSTTLSLKTAERLRAMILSGELAPGSRLRQIEFADRFDVSPTPIREAFRTLAEEGLVVHDAQRGVVVFTPTVEDVFENYEIRIALEPLATELAARRITDEELERLGRLVEKMRKTPSAPVYQGLNREFHALIYAAARRPRLAQMIESLREAFEAYVGIITTHPDPAYGSRVRAQHEEIAEALAQRSSRRARKLMREHLELNRDHIAASVEGYGDGAAAAAAAATRARRTAVKPAGKRGRTGQAASKRAKARK